MLRLGEEQIVKIVVLVYLDRWYRGICWRKGRRSV